MKTYIWRGYEHTAVGIARHNVISYYIELSEEKFKELWKAFKKWKGSQQDFYFEYVNPYKLCELPKDPTLPKIVHIKTELKGGKRE